MFIRIMSDLHIEMAPYVVEEMPEDNDTVLVLAGDIGLFKHVDLEKFIREMSERFHHVIYTPGNHEYYGGYYPHSMDKFKDQIVDLMNVELLDKGKVTIDNVVFIVATLWTSYDNGNPVAIMNAQNMMNDYRKIRTGPKLEPWRRKITATEFHADHLVAKNYIFTELEKWDGTYKEVVVTHHGPSYQSVTEGFRGNPLNHAYVSELGEEIVTSGPDIWIHGHIHSSLDYEIGDTRIVTNPKGYPMNKEGTQHENSRFNPLFRIEL